MIRTTEMARAFKHAFAFAAIAACGLAPLAAFAQQDQTTPNAQQQSQPLQTVTVTGSLIKRTDIETPSPVQVISSVDITQSGYTTVEDVLRNVSANGAGTLSQGFSQAFASGASGIALRGLTVGDTLTLIDGERMVAYPLSDDAERSFVDVTAIPLAAVEGVEVLKDGASSTYGADAIAGVVNVKLRKTFVGAQLTAEGGRTQEGGGTTEHVSGIWGMGDLSENGYNFWVAMDWRHQDAVLASQRNGLFTNNNWSGLPDGLNTTPGAVGASDLAYPDSTTGYLVDPATGNVIQYLPGCTAAMQAANQCTFPYKGGQLQPPTSQVDVLAKFTKSLGDSWNLVVTPSVFDSVAQQVAPQGFGHVYAITGVETGSIDNISFGPTVPGHIVVYPVISLPATSPLNQTDENAYLQYSFGDVGPFITDINTATYRLFIDLAGTALGWDVDFQSGLMYADTVLEYEGSIVPSIAQQAITDGAYIPGVSTNGGQIFAPEDSANDSSTLWVEDFHASRDLFDMPGGPLSLAWGAQYIHKALNVTDPPSVVSGYQEGTILFAVGSQDDTAGFFELEGNPIKPLEVDVGGRYDHYDTYGGSFTPKVGVKFTPLEMLSLRGTWGKGFRAPSIAESGNAGLAFGAGNTADPVLCANGPNVAGSYNALCNFPIVGVESSNPALKAVTSTNTTAGIVFQPIKQFDATLDWYHIVLTNDIISAEEAGGFFADEIGIVRGPAVTLPVCTATTAPNPCPTANVLTPVGYPSYIGIPYVNAGTTKTAGWDLELHSRFDVGSLGSLKASLDWTYISEYSYFALGQFFDLAGTHGPSGVSGDTGNPRQRAVAELTWEKGPFTTQLTAEYRSSFSVIDPSSGYATCLAALEGAAPSSYLNAIQLGLASLPSAWNQYCTVHHFTDINSYMAYQLNDHVQVHFAITNLFNSPPALDLATYGGGASARYTTLDQDGAIGRFFLLGATVKF